MRASGFSILVISLLTLTACDRAPIAEPATPAETKAAEETESGKLAAPSDPAVAKGPVLAIEAEGLRLFNPDTGAARPISFGMAQADVITALAFRGPAGTGTMEECGAGPLQYANWPDGLGLHFQGDKFVGWTVDGRSDNALTTASGIGTGSTRAELEAAYSVEVSETTLGTEFSAGELFGILDGKSNTAKITNLWAGVSCNFR